MSDASPVTASSPGVVAWLTGLPSSGKSTLAAHLARRLRAAGRPFCVLDGDEVRRTIVPAPGYDRDARDAFYATLARLAALLARQGLVVVVAATAHRQAYRVEARRLAPDFLEVHVDVSADECRIRDDKGLYAGQVRGLPGADLAYEPPLSPDVVAHGGNDEAALRRALHLLGHREAGS
jgi:adenylylsulfate kinase